MKKIFFAMLLIGNLSFTLEASDITGLWTMPKDKKTGRIAVARIYENNGKFYAVGFAFTDLSTSTETDTQNPDPALHSRPMNEVPVINGIVIEKGKLANGEIYNPSAGKYYYLKGSLSEDKQQINWRATIDKAGLFGPTIVWKKVKDESTYKSFELSKNKLNSIIPTVRHKK